MATGSVIKYAIILVCFASLWTCHDAADTLKPGDTLNSTSSLLSASGTFTLNFIEKAIRGSDNSFIAILRVKSGANKAWIANRDTPILSSSSPLLTLDSNNTLKITHQNGDPFVLFSAPQTNDPNTSVVATLLDSGNFVLQEVNSVSGSTIRVFWQSFDYPVDTFLPGMKLGVDHRNGYNWSLLSWGTRDNPVSSGPYSLEWDTDAHQLKIKRSGTVYWTSGVYADGRFQFILPDVSKKRYNFSIVSNQDEDYLTYTSLDDPTDPEPEWVLYTRGALYEYGASVDIIQAQNCDGYNIVGGCVRRDRPSDCTGKLVMIFIRKRVTSISLTLALRDPPTGLVLVVRIVRLLVGKVVTALDSTFHPVVRLLVQDADFGAWTVNSLKTSLQILLLFCQQRNHPHQIHHLRERFVSLAMY
ncbi:G-type lectin S-receptor-like serine/threonine-protein kinase At1g67520 [Pyrus x bretschneideri]|uniref:G-type lectin S-receptor-like serine/threonine-protein kinase At1g67520 n=1 Tax=Pyrus x bretschneideri TaxID=225117 RepID=UPI00202E8DF9|nr:G-type lectin S-receptor-like serine/threonine-protein kinase At1g67520 [Pyrus x bretschneideri]